MFDHVTIRVADLDASGSFYAPSTTCGSACATRRLRGASTRRSHPSSDSRCACGRAAVEAGYRGNGAPGERPEYHAGYYAAYVLDPDGHNVEAVFHDR